METDSGRRLMQTIDSQPEPHTAEPWFQDRPPERREELALQYQAGLERGVEISASEHRRMLCETLAISAIFLIGDLACVRGGWGKAFLATLAGTVLGYALCRLDAQRLLTGGLCLAVYLVGESLATGFAGLHLLACFPLGAACAYVGYMREERGMT